MALTLATVLSLPALAHSMPALLAGDPARRTVRWVHSSDIYDIAALLRGGELLLTTGLGLAGRSPEERRAYIRALADKEVAGVALEFSETFAAIPPEMVEEARLVDLPLIALREVYPFVEVTEQVNAALLDASIVRLRHADEVGRALSLVLAERGGLDNLAATLAELLGRPVVLTDPGGAVLTAVAGDAAAVAANPSAGSPVMADGILLGVLALGDGPRDDELVEAAMDRAPEIFALEMLRGRQQPLLVARERRRLFERMLSSEPDDPQALHAHAATVRIRPDARWAGLALGPADRDLAAAVTQDAAREAGVPVLAAEMAGTTYGLVALSATDGRAQLTAFASALGTLRGPLAALGPVVASTEAGRSLRSARQTLLVAGTRPSGGRVLFAHDLAVERVLAAVTDRSQLRDLVDEQLGVLLRTRRSSTLLDTLETFLGTGCNKAATGRALHLRRQSVHQRLARISVLLGDDVDDPRRQTALRLAVAAERLLRAGPG